MENKISPDKPNLPDQPQSATGKLRVAKLKSHGGFMNAMIIEWSGALACAAIFALGFAVTMFGG